MRSIRALGIVRSVVYPPLPLIPWFLDRFDSSFYLLPDSLMMFSGSLSALTRLNGMGLLIFLSKSKLTESESFESTRLFLNSEKVFRICCFLLLFYSGPFSDLSKLCLLLPLLIDSIVSILGVNFPVYTLYFLVKSFMYLFLLPVSRIGLLFLCLSIYVKVRATFALF